HLPQKYRTPIMLCYFEGLTHDEAAARLGWRLGTVKGRLSRARDLLRKRLTRRGVVLSATAIISELGALEAKAAVPAFLQLSTINAARALAGHGGASVFTMAVVALPVSTLVEGVLQAMIFSQVKSVALSFLVVVGTVTTGLVVAATQQPGKVAGSGGSNQAKAAPDGGPQQSATDFASKDFVTKGRPHDGSSAASKQASQQ